MELVHEELFAAKRRNWRRGPKLSVIGAISVDGVEGLRITERSVIERTFVDFIEEDLAPVLQPYNGINSKSVVILGKDILNRFRKQCLILRFSKEFNEIDHCARQSCL